MRRSTNILQAPHSGGGCDIDDGSPAAPYHVRPDGLRRQENDVQFLAQGFVPLIKGHVAKGCHANASAIVVQDVDAARGTNGCLDPAIDGIFTRCRSEEHTSELQSLMRNSNAVFCLKKKTNNNITS